MNEPTLNPKFVKTLKLIIRTFLAFFVLLLSIFLVVSFDTEERKFKEDYVNSKHEWKTVKLPANEVMTIYLYKDNLRSNFGLNEGHFILGGYYGTQPNKIAGKDDIFQQVVYTKQATIPDSVLQSGLEYQVNNVTLLESLPIDALKETYPTFFLKEATIIAVNQVNSNKGNSQSIGKPIITGTDFTKNANLIKNNLKLHYLISHSILALFLIVLIIFNARFFRKTNFFEKGISVLIAIFYGLILINAIQFYPNLFYANFTS